MPDIQLRGKYPLNDCRGNRLMGQQFVSVGDSPYAVIPQTTKTIKKDTELFIDYGSDYFEDVEGGCPCANRNCVKQRAKILGDTLSTPEGMYDSWCGHARTYEHNPISEDNADGQTVDATPDPRERQNALTTNQRRGPDGRRRKNLKTKERRKRVRISHDLEEKNRLTCTQQILPEDEMAS